MGLWGMTNAPTGTSRPRVHGDGKPGVAQSPRPAEKMPQWRRRCSDSRWHPSQAPELHHAKTRSPHPRSARSLDRRRRRINSRTGAVDGTRAKPPCSLPPPSPVTPAVSAKDIQGLDVFGSDGQQVGKVAKVNTVADGNVKDVEVQSSGFLGFFAKTYVVPADKLNKKGGRIELSMTSDQAKQLMRAYPPRTQ